MFVRGFKLPRSIGKEPNEAHRNVEAPTMGKRQIERALAQEQRLVQRQELLKRLWKLNRRSEAKRVEQERPEFAAPGRNH